MIDEPELTDIIMQAVALVLTETHTTTIARVSEVGETTIECEPVINRVRENGDSVRLPKFIQVPPIFLHGGASYLAHPITVGDYALLIFTERAYDRWYAGDDFKKPPVIRMHNYSDGFALVALRPASTAIPIPDETTMTGTTRMGVPNPSDFMALALKVEAQLAEIKEALDHVQTQYNAHTHAYVSPSGAATTTGLTPAISHDYEDDEVKSAHVEAE